MFKELNSKRTIREGIDLQALPFVKLKEMAGQDVKVDGFFFTDGGYGRQVVVVGNDKKINMPSRAVSLFEDIKNDPKLLDALLGGHCMITNIKEMPTKKGSTVLFEVADC